MIVGLTGGIGSGKTLVSSMFKKLGIPVYITDDEAKKIMVTDLDVVDSIIQLFGEKAYLEKGLLNRKFIASKVFSNKDKLQKLNAIVHPRVSDQFKKWYHKQDAPFVIKESAILFESQGHKHCNAVILVTAPEAIRIQRVIKRDKTDAELVKNRMNNQWQDAKKIPLSDYVIFNIDKQETEKQVEEIFESLLGK